MAVPNFLSHFSTQSGAGNAYVRGSSIAHDQSIKRRQARVAEKQAAAAMMNAKTALKRMKSDEVIEKNRLDQQKKEFDITTEFNKRKHEDAVKDSLLDKAIDAAELEREAVKVASDIQHRNANQNLNESIHELSKFTSLIDARHKFEQAKHWERMAKAKRVGSEAKNQVTLAKLTSNDAEHIKIGLNSVLDQFGGDIDDTDDLTPVQLNQAISTIHSKAVEYADAVGRNSSGKVHVPMPEIYAKVTAEWVRDFMPHLKDTGTFADQYQAPINPQTGMPFRSNDPLPEGVSGSGQMGEALEHWLQNNPDKAYQLREMLGNN